MKLKLSTILITILIIILNIYQNVNGQLLTLTDSNSILLQYPTDTSTPTCNFYFYILVSNSSVITPQSIDSIQYGSFTGKLISSNSTTALFQLIYTDVAIGTISTIEITANDITPVYGSIILNYECREVDVTSIQVEVVEEVNWSTTLKYSSIVKLIGLPDSVGIYFFGVSQFDGQISQLGNSAYLILYRETYYISKVATDTIWTINVTYSNGNVLQVSVPFNASKTIDSNTDLGGIFDFTGYPLNGEFKATSIVFGPLVKFRTTTSLQRPIMSMYANTLYSTPKPISGSKGNVTYISFCYLIQFAQNNTIYTQRQDSSFSDDLTFVSTISSIDVGYDLPLGDNGDILLDSDTTDTPTFTFSFPGIEDGYSMKLVSYSTNKGSYILRKGWPFGFSHGTNVYFYLNITFPIVYTSNIESINFYASTNNNGITKSFNSIDFKIATVRPKITFYESFYLGNFKYLLRIHADSPAGIKNFGFSVDSQTYLFGNDYLISGNSLNGVWEFLYDAVYLGETKSSFLVTDFNDVQSAYTEGDRLTVQNPEQSIYFPRMTTPTNGIDYIKDLKDVSFMFNNVNVANQTIDNIMYFTFNNIANYKDLEIGLTLTDQKSLRDIRFSSSINQPSYRAKYNFAKWDSLSNRFIVKFKVPANTIPGTLDYRLVFTKTNSISSTYLPASYQLNIISPNIDIYGPVITNLVKQTMGWSFTIEDDINGFASGFITVRGVNDNSLYNFTLSIQDMLVGSGDRWMGNYQINMNLNTLTCVAQDYIITYASFTDSFGNTNIYYRFETDLEYQYEATLDSSSNPFLNYIGDYSILTITIDSSVCKGQSNANPPVLLSFVSSLSEMDVGSPDRQITFTFEASAAYGLKENQYPIVYLVSQSFEAVECVSSIVSMTATTASYICTVEVPIGFANPNGFLLSVYGFINNDYRYSGYSSATLKEMGFDWYVKTLQYDTTAPIIKYSETIDNEGGSFWVYGRGFKSVDRIGFSYSDSTYQEGSFITTYDSAILVNSTKATSSPFTIELFSSAQTTVRSKPLTVTPIVYNFNYVDPTTQPPVTITPSSTPTSTSIPTNPPKKCLNECSGPTHGVCTTKGCSCISPWAGLDCSSRVIEIKPPVVNNTNPSIEIPIPGGSGGIGTGTGGSSSLEPGEILYKSLISIVSVRELDFTGVKVINTYPLSKWEFTEVSSTISEYYTSISITDKPLFNIKTTLQWFNQSSTVEFAGQILQMNPSSIKFTIDISEYPFASPLNQLQLVMSASLVSSKTNDICSSKQFGNTTNGDDSNFIKLQIEDHSVYGRFIKRAIVDNEIVAIENVLLDSSMTTISNEYSAQTFIGITIPYFSKSVIVDPDFSVLLDSSPSSSSSENSICSNKKSGLSGAKIAGIAIGSFGFAAVIAISTWYGINKTRKNKKFIANVQNKLSSMN